MRAVITEPGGFRCAPEGHTVKVFPMGAEVTGAVAEWAIAAGKADPVDGVSLETKPSPALETKPARGRPRK